VDPSVEIRVRDVPRQEIQGLVERGEADVGFAIFLKPAAGIDLTPLFSFQLMYLAAAGALADHGQVRESSRSNGPGARSKARRSGLRQGMKPLPWSEMPSLPLIGLSADTPVQEVIETRLSRVRRPPSSGQVCHSMLTMIGMVGAGLGAAILPSMVAPVCPSSRFDMRRLVGPATQLRFHQIRKKGHRLPPIAEPFLETMVRVVAEQCERQPA
jgi:DNA-binding transcriptional LysR family regulator